MPGSGLQAYVHQHGLCDEREPLNVYGQTKYEGELAVETLEKYFIVRIAWVFGVNGKNFIKTMLNLGKTRDSLTVVDDQIGSPTYTYDLARLLVDMVETEKYGRYHATNEGLCSWYEFACEIFKEAGIQVKVSPVSSDMYPARAKRPMNSRMDKSKLRDMGFEPMPSWQDALRRYLEVIGERRGCEDGGLKAMKADGAGRLHWKLKVTGYGKIEAAEIEAARTQGSSTAQAAEVGLSIQFPK